VTAVTDILSELSRRGVMAVVDGNTLRLRPKSALDDVLLDRIRNIKPAVLEALRKRPATCAPSCYEIEPGRWVHHPADGCWTQPSSGPENILTAQCRHCDGNGECECPACTLRRTEKPVPCLMCQPAKRKKWLTSTVETRCWHCHGSRVCRCIVCWNAQNCQACECVICHGIGAVLGRVN
jgi:hypothetical protein